MAQVYRILRGLKNAQLCHHLTFYFLPFTTEPKQIYPGNVPSRSDAFDRARSQVAK